jgi:hypothetical protein
MLPPDVLEATKTAEAFLDLQQRAKSPSWDGRGLDPMPRLLWWDDSTPLFEFSLIDQVAGRQGGYLIVSTTPDLPPVLQYATEGASLCDTLSNLLP